MSARPCSPDRALTRLARLYGVLPRHRDNEGRLVDVSPEALRRVLAALGADGAEDPDPTDAARARRLSLWRRVVEPVVTTWLPGDARLTLRLPAHSRGPIAVRVACEDGSVVEHRFAAPPAPHAVRDVDGQAFVRVALPLPAALPAGYHDGEVDVAGHAWRFCWIVAPRRVHPPADRGFGVFVPLYALHSRRRRDCADLTEWRRFAAWAGEAGATLVGTLPLCSAFLDEPVAISPYAPVSRLFWNEIYVDVDRLPAAAPAIAPPEAPRDEPVDLVDWPRVAARRTAVLAAAADRWFASTPDDPAFAAWRRRRPDAELFARFRAMQQQHGRDWRAWPPAVRDAPELAAADERARRRHLYAQWCVQQQLDETLAGMRAHGTEPYLDLPLGVHPDGYDAWAYRDEFVDGCSVGAPPDPFFSRGQDWGFRPMHPHAARRAHHRYFRACLQHQMAHCGALRIDHVMGLYRTWCVPHGSAAHEGCYVRQPADELWAIVALESERRRCAVVGEDLGTVPHAVDRALERHDALSMHVVQFSLSPDDPGAALAPPQRSLAGLNTHDMPTFAAFWTAADVADRQALGLLDDDGARAERERRTRTVAALARRLGLPEDADGAVAARHSLSALAGSAAAVVVASLEDLWGETRPQNVPGTGDERPNWRRRTRTALDGLIADDDVRNALAAIAAARHR